MDTAYTNDDYEEPDYYQEYKDDVAMGYINEDGSYREPDPTAYLEAQALEEHQDHIDKVHQGNPCTCPPVDWETNLAEHQENVHAGGECDCTPPF
jgi:hypothetical protein